MPPRASSQAAGAPALISFCVSSRPRSRRAARSEEAADAPEGCTAGQLLALLAAKHAGLAALAPSLQLALNQRYAPRDAPLADGDELALIPPISGG